MSTQSPATLLLKSIEIKVPFNYSAGTNFYIHSASLEPNYPAEIEILVDDAYCENSKISPWLVQKILAEHDDELDTLVWEHISGY